MSVSKRQAALDAVRISDELDSILTNTIKEAAHSIGIDEFQLLLTITAAIHPESFASQPKNALLDLPVGVQQIILIAGANELARRLTEATMLIVDSDGGER